MEATTVEPKVEAEKKPTPAPAPKASALSSPDIGDLVGALAVASLKFKPLLKESTNPHYNSKFADLAACINSVRDALAEQGLVVLQPMSARSDGFFLRTIICHKSGQFIGSEIPIAADWENPNPQKLGSTLTYLRRYAFCALLDIAADEDDDGEGASKSYPTRDAVKSQNGNGSYQRSNQGTQRSAPWEGGSRTTGRAEALAEKTRPAKTAPAREPGGDDIPY